MWSDIPAEGKNSVRGGVSITRLKRSSSRGEASKKTVTGHESSQIVARKRKGAFEQGPRWPKSCGKSAKGP